MNGLFLISEDIYGGTRKKIIAEVARRYPLIEFKYINLFKENLIKSNVIFLESCSNPNGYIFDPKQFQNIDDDTYIIIDNTWLSPEVFNPFKYKGGKKIVIDSCTKYLSGGTCMLGSICFEHFDDPMINSVKKYIENTGINVPQQCCDVILDIIDSLSERVEYSYARTLDAISILKTFDQVDMINHPSVHSSDLIPYLNGGPSVIYFHIKHLSIPMDHKYYISQIAKVCKFRYMTSFAHSEDSIDPCSKKDDNGLWIRMSFGYFDDSDLVYKLQQFMRYFHV
ncbi:MAG: PLP-dependent aspartate aminotransferase family protein [Nitrososphaeraceae archaeon]|nr:PLP-dependent aspartate aminotransferase family protein [Nitrososphaeraceae archaeon]